ncbi:hypothetical protein KSP40_PGU016207 [Platanthera guangdongensis]|uniref:Uncharacterized protein n=1 Tax=Platanthera guangdongensis TaxID=2320717 RepID=A0ABR2LQ92_9ASPA
MAFPSSRSMTRACFSSLRPLITISKTAQAAQSSFISSTTRATSRSPSLRLLAFSSNRKNHFAFPSLRSPVELACCSGSLLPPIAAVEAKSVASRLHLNSRNCQALSQGTIFCRAHPGP